MNITVIGAGAIGGHIAAKLAAAGESVERRGARRAPEGDPRTRAQAQGGRRGDRRARRGDRPHRRGRRRRTSSCSGSRRISSRRSPPRSPRSSRPRRWSDDAERHSVVVFLQARRPARGRSARERRSRRRDRRAICRSTPSSPPSSIRRRRSRAPASSGISRAIACRSPKSTAQKTERIAALVRALHARRASSRRSLSDVRTEIWMKLWGNLTFNPISALTHATLEDICRFPPTRALAAAMMREAQTVGEAFGIRFRLRDRQAHRRRRERSARTRPRCCRTSSTAARSRSTRCSAR